MPQKVEERGKELKIPCQFFRDHRAGHLFFCDSDKQMNKDHLISDFRVKCCSTVFHPDLWSSLRGAEPLIHLIAAVIPSSSFKTKTTLNGFVEKKAS